MATATAPADSPAVFKSLFIWTEEEFNSIKDRPKRLRFNRSMSMPKTCFTGFSPFLGIVLALQIKYEAEQGGHVDATCAGLGMPVVWQLYHLLGKYLDDPDDEASLDKALKLWTHVRDYFLLDVRPKGMSSTPMINLEGTLRIKMEDFLDVGDHKQDDEKAVEGRGVMRREEVVELRKLVAGVFGGAYYNQGQVLANFRMADLEPVGREIDELISSDKLDGIRNGEARRQVQTLAPDHYTEEFPKCQTLLLLKGGNVLQADLTMTGQLHNTLRAIARLLDVDVRNRDCFAEPVYVEVVEDEKEKPPKGIAIENVTIHYRNRLRPVADADLADEGEKAKLHTALLRALHALDEANVVHGRLRLDNFRKDEDNGKYVLVNFGGSFALPLPGLLQWPRKRGAPRDVTMFASGFCTEHAQTRRSFPLTLDEAVRLGRLVPPELCLLGYEDAAYKSVKKEAPSFFAIGKPTDMFDAGIIRATLGGMQRPQWEELRTRDGVKAWATGQRGVEAGLVASLIGTLAQRAKQRAKKGTANLLGGKVDALKAGMVRMDPSSRFSVDELLEIVGNPVAPTQLSSAAARDRDEGLRAFGGMYEGESQEEEREMWPLPVSDKMAEHPMYLEHLDLVDDNKRLKRKLRRVRRDIRDLCRALDLPIPSRGHSSRRRRR